MTAPVSDPAQPPDRPRRARKSGVVVPHQPRWFQRLGAWLVFVLVRLVSATLRYRWLDESHYFDQAPARPAIYAIWHNRLALCMQAYEGLIKRHRAEARLAALVSASKDGGFLAAILECFDVEPVRGSSSRRGPQALLELTTWAEQNYDLAITPDGPRGPRYVVQEGAVYLAQITGLPIIPCSYHAAWKISLKSWDRFQIPLPFSRVEMRLGEAVRVPRETTDAEREQLRQKVEQNLKAITRD